MDANQTQQINTFIRGMNTDTSDAFMPDTLYRYAENLRLSTDTDNNSGELHMIEGNVSWKSFDIGTHNKIIAATSIREYAIVIIRTYSNTSSNTEDRFTPVWYIYRIKKGDSSDNSSATRDCIFGPCTEPIWDEEESRPCLLTRFESENNIKLYIADGIHELMQLNITDTPAADAVPTNILNLIGYANIALPPIGVKVSSSSGRLKPARVQYCYRLYSKNGAPTKISSFSNTVSLYETGKTGYPYTENTTTGRAVDLTIPAISSDSFNLSETLDHIQIFRITYFKNGQQPNISLLADLTYSGSQTMIIDTGAFDIKDISIDEFLTYVSFGIIPKLIESKNNYLFAGNLKYKKSETDEKFKDIDVTTHVTDANGFSGRGKYFEWIIQPSSSAYSLSEYEDFKSQHFSFRPGETYRFGIILYDNEGNASSVKHMLDITIPDYDAFYRRITNNPNSVRYDTNDGIIFLNGQQNGSNYVQNIAIRPIEILIRRTVYTDDTNTRYSEISNCSRYEVVRCIRTLSDKRTITQGLIGRPIQGLNNNIYPSGFMTLDYMQISDKLHLQDESGIAGINYNTATYSPATNILMFASPEYVYQPDDTKNIIDANINNLRIKTVNTYTCPTQILSEWSDLPDAPVYIFLECNKDPRTHCRISSTNSGSYDYGKLSLWFALETANDNENNIIGQYPVFDYVTAYYGKSDLISFNRNDVTGYIACNYINPRRIYRDSAYNRKSLPTDLKITAAGYPDVPKYNQIATGETLRFEDDVTQVGNYTYHGWSSSLMSGTNINSSGYIKERWLNDGLLRPYDSTEGDSRRKAGCYMGTTGKCILFLTSKSITTNGEYYGEYWDTSGFGSGLFNIDVVDIRKSPTPYGGTTESALNNSVYYSFGDNFANENANSSRPYTIYNSIRTGDCFIGMFSYNALHNWYDTTFVGAIKSATVYNVPIISDIDIRAQYGMLFDDSASKGYYIQDTAASFDDYTQSKDAYMYNTAYNSHPDVVGYTADLESETDSNNHDVRVHYSEAKTDGESLDSWLLFKSANFLDVDSRYGEITNLRLFKDKLIFWLNNATGVLAVNERIILQDANATQVVLGTGSVLERYDYFTTVYGMKPNLNCDAQSSVSLYWWDGYNREILQYTDKYSVTPLSTISNIKNYLNDESHEENTYPKLIYDNKYKEIICSCVENESIVYNETAKIFVSVYKFMPLFDIKINGCLYTLDSTQIYLQNACNENNTSKLFKTIIYPKLQYVVNKNSDIVKTFDNLSLAGRFYGGDDLSNLNLIYKTPLKQESSIENGEGITNVEYDFKVAIPRNENSDYGDRMRGKTMRCEINSMSNSTDFSIQYIKTKYRMSWS